MIKITRSLFNIVLVIFVTGLLISCTRQESLQFIVIGDWGMQGNDDQKQVALQMEKLAADGRIDFIVTTGDNFYPVGVKSVDDPLWQKNFEEIYSLRYLKSIPWYVTLGNHDYFGDFQAEIAYAKDHPRWILPATHYSRDFKSGGRTLAKLLFLDSSPYLVEYQRRPDLYHHVDTQDPVKQTEWLTRELDDNSPTWKLVFAHHPLFTSGAHGNTGELIEAWSGILSEYNVDAYFAGHDHHLEHIKTEGPTHFFISGGGGAGTRRVGKGEYTLFSLSTHGIAHVILDHSCMRVRFIDKLGEEIYKTDIPSTDTDSCKN